MSANARRSSHPDRSGVASSVLAHLPPADRKALSPVLARCPRIRLDAGAALPARELPQAALFVVDEGMVVVARAAEQSRRRMVVALAPRRRRAAAAGARRGDLRTRARRAHGPGPRGARGVPLTAVRRGRRDTSALRRHARVPPELAVFGRTSHTERLHESSSSSVRRTAGSVAAASSWTLPLTHALLAEIGSARETVSAALGEFAAAGFVHRNGRVYRLAVRPEDL